MKTYCLHCADPVDTEDPAVHREASIWITGPKSNRSSQRAYTGAVCCAECMKAINAGQAPGEATLFDTTPAAPNQEEYVAGHEAGFRGDELASGKSNDWLSGYESGQMARELRD